MIPTQILTTAGRFRDNRRGTIRVDVTAGDMAELVIIIPPGHELPGQETRIVLAGEHLTVLRRDLGKAIVKPKRIVAVA